MDEEIGAPRLGEGEQITAAAEPYSVARLCLEEVVPDAVEDARRVVDLLRAAASAHASTGVTYADVDVP